MTTPLEAYQARKVGKPKPTRPGPNPWMTWGVSVAAFLISLAGFYLNSLRIVDDVRFVLNNTTAKIDFDGEDKTIVSAALTGTFVNSGNRSTLIGGVGLWVQFVTENEQGICVPDAGKGDDFAFKVESFVLRPGEMQQKTISLDGIKEVKRPLYETLVAKKGVFFCLQFIVVSPEEVIESKYVPWVRFYLFQDRFEDSGEKIVSDTLLKPNQLMQVEKVKPRRPYCSKGLCLYYEWLWGKLGKYRDEADLFYKD